MCKNSHIWISSFSRILLSSLFFQSSKKNFLISNFHSFTSSNHQTLTILFIFKLFSPGILKSSHFLSSHSNIFFHDQVVTPRKFYSFLLTGAEQHIFGTNSRSIKTCVKKKFCASWLLGAQSLNPSNWCHTLAFCFPLTVWVHIVWKTQCPCLFFDLRWLTVWTFLHM